MIYFIIFVSFGFLAYLTSALQTLVPHKAFGWVSWFSGLASFTSLSVYLIMRHFDIDNGFLMIITMLTQLAKGN